MFEGLVGDREANPRCLWSKKGYKFNQIHEVQRNSDEFLSLQATDTQCESLTFNVFFVNVVGGRKIIAAVVL